MSKQSEEQKLVNARIDDIRTALNHFREAAADDAEVIQSAFAHKTAAIDGLVEDLKLKSDRIEALNGALNTLANDLTNAQFGLESAHHKIKDLTDKLTQLENREIKRDKILNAVINYLRTQAQVNWPADAALQWIKSQVKK